MHLGDRDSKGRLIMRPGKTYTLLVYTPYTTGLRRTATAVSNQEPYIMKRANYYKALGFKCEIDVHDKLTGKYLETIIYN